MIIKYLEYDDCIRHDKKVQIKFQQ